MPTQVGQIHKAHPRAVDPQSRASTQDTDMNTTTPNKKPKLTRPQRMTFVDTWRSKLFKTAFRARYNHIMNRIPSLSLPEHELKNPYIASKETKAD